MTDVIKNPMFNFMQRLSDTTQMVSDHLAGELGIERKVFASRLKHSQMVAMLSCSVASVLISDVTDMWDMGILHDGGHRILGHQCEDFTSLKITKHGINRTARHEPNLDGSLHLSKLNPNPAIIEAGKAHSGERKVYRLIPGEPVEGAVIADEIDINRNERVYDLAPMSVKGCILRICDPLCHIRDDHNTLVRLGILAKAPVPTDEYIARSFIENSRISDDDTVIAIDKHLFDWVIELRLKVESWQKSEQVLELRKLEQKLLQDYWDIKIDGGMRPEQIVDNMNIITETEFFEVLEAHGAYKRKVLA